MPDTEQKQNLEQIKHDVNRTITHNIDWFTPPDEKNLVGALLIWAIAEPLLLEFFKAIASEGGKQFFSSAFQHFQKHGAAAPAPREKPSAEELEAAAAQAGSAARGMTVEEFQKKMDTITAALKDRLQTLMPEETAAGIANEYRATLVTNLI